MEVELPKKNPKKEEEVRETGSDTKQKADQLMT